MKRFLFLLLFSIFCSFNATAQWDEIDWGWDIDQWQNWYDEYWDDGECIDYGTGFCDEQILDEVNVCGNCDDEPYDPFPLNPEPSSPDPEIPDPCEENPDDCYGDDDGGGSGNNGDDDEEKEKQWYLDNDSDGYHSESQTATGKPDGNWKETTNGEDCDDTKPEVHKLNKCQKCEPEPADGKCKDCVDDNTNNQYDVDPSTGELSQEGLDLLKAIETLELQPYDDTNPNGGTLTEWNKHATIGYGHLIDESEWDTYKNGITEEQANDLFVEDIDAEIASLRAMNGSLTQNQFDAMAIFSFNIGGGIGGGFHNSSARKMLEDCEDEASNYDKLEDAWKAFNKQGGNVVPGLDNRRNAEWNIFVDGVYEQW